MISESVGTANSGVPMKTMRRLMVLTSLRARAGPPSLGGRFAFRCLGEFPDHPVALQLREVIDEQFSVEMVDFMLHAGRAQALGLLLARLAIQREVAESDARGAFDLLGIFRDREAAFLVRAQFLRAPDDLRIDEDLRIGLRLRLALRIEPARDLLAQITDHDALEHADLDGREADA